MRYIFSPNASKSSIGETSPYSLLPNISRTDVSDDTNGSPKLPASINTVGNHSEKLEKANKCAAA